VAIPKFTPSFRVRSDAHGVRLTLTGVTYASGATLQEAADELVRKILVMLMAFRGGAVAPAGRGFRVDPGIHGFISELASYAARGGDIRDRLFTTL
jgi:hypothetical protein